MSNRQVTDDEPDSNIDGITEPLNEKNDSQRNQDQGKLALILRRELRILHSEFSGPLPHPDLWAGYEKVLPGSSDRILKEFEEESGHRRQMESQSAHSDAQVVHSNIKLAERGQIYGLVIAIIALLGSIFLIYFDKPWGISLPIAAATGLVSIFLYVKSGKSERKKESTQDETSTQPPSKNRV